MKNIFITISDQQDAWIREEASKREITLTAMIRRIIDDRYEKPQEKTIKDPQ